jgi:hypothetical protein
MFPLSNMDKMTVDGLELLLFFKTSLDQYCWINLQLDTSLKGKPGVVNLVELLKYYDAPIDSQICRLVIPFIRSLKQRHSNVLSFHKLLFVRGSNVSKLQLSFQYGNTFNMSEFDVADLKSIVFDVATGSKVRSTEHLCAIHLILCELLILKPFTYNYS